MLQVLPDTQVRVKLWELLQIIISSPYFFTQTKVRIKLRVSIKECKQPLLV